MEIVKKCQGRGQFEDRLAIVVRRTPGPTEGVAGRRINIARAVERNPTRGPDASTRVCVDGLERRDRAGRTRRGGRHPPAVVSAVAPTTTERDVHLAVVERERAP